MVYPSEADMALLQQYRFRRDEQAFAEIVRRYAGVVFGTCHRILGDRARSQEVAQETFFRLTQKPESVTRSLGGWLHRVATQLAIDTVRSDAARQDREKAYRKDNPREVMTISQWEELSPMIDEALAEMEEEDRMLLVRHFLQGVSQADLALEQLTSPATISRRIKDAIEELRKQLKKKGAIAGAAALAVMLGEATVEAAPAALMGELGKMTMVSGTPGSPGSGTPGTGSGPLPPSVKPQHVPADAMPAAVPSQALTYVVMAMGIVAAAAIVMLLVALANQGGDGSGSGSSGGTEMVE